MSSALYHLVEPSSWAQWQGEACYRPASLAREGFIHFSRREQVEATAARFYSSCETLLVVRVDTSRLLAELRYELADGQRFPHLYGALNLDAVGAVAEMHRDHEGQYRLPPRFDESLRPNIHRMFRAEMRGLAVASSFRMPGVNSTLRNDVGVTTESRVGHRLLLVCALRYPGHGPNSEQQKNHPALFVMAPVSNTGIDDAGIDDDVADSNEPGLSSAMHDIRMLAKSYQREPSPTLELGGVSMNASYLLQPKTTPRRESWKSIALGLMVLLGLSTSALALTLYSAVDKDKPEFAPVQLQLETSSFDAPEEVQHEQVLASEPPIYRVATAPEIAVPAPEVRESKAPAVARQAVRKPLASKARSSFDKIDTCDEVACLLDGSDACCEQYESVQANQPIVSEERYRPYRLTRAEIMQPMQSIRGRIAVCADSYGYDGVATVKLVVSPLGAVSSVALSDGTGDFQACVEKHVKTLSFPELLQPFSFAYPFTL